MFKAVLTCGAVAVLLAAPVAAQEVVAMPEAGPLKVETLAAPIRTMQLYRDTWVPNADGRGWTRLLFYHHYRIPIPCQTVAINTATGRVTRFVLKEKAPSGAPWRWTIGHDGKCYMGHYGSAAVWIYDPALNTLDFVESGIKNVSTVSAIATGTDGKIYGSTTPKIITFQFDPETRTFADYGIQGGERQYLGYGYTVAADDEYVYTAAGKIPWMCVAYNKKTGEQKVLFQGDQADYIAVGQGRYGCTASHSINVGPEKGTTRKYWLYKGEAIEQQPGDKPPWPEPAATEQPALPPRPEENLDEAVPGTDGRARYWWRTPEARAAAPKDAPEGATPKDLGWQSVEYDIEVAPVRITWLREMPDGRLLGVGEAYQDWFVADPATDACQVLGRIPLSHYDTVFAHGKAWMIGYPSTPLYEYDPARPWTPGHGTPDRPAPPLDHPASNPRRVAHFASLIQTHHGRAGAPGADGCIYIGAHAERSHVGGGLGWWNPKTGEAGGLREPFELFDVAGLCAVDEGRAIVFSSRLVTDPATGKRADAARLFLFDVEKKALVSDFAPFEGVADTGPILPAGGATVVGVAGGEPVRLYRADVAAGRVVAQVALPARPGGDFRLGPDGWIWTFLGEVLVRIEPQTLAISPVGTAAPGRIAFAGRDVYLAGQPELRAVRGIVP